MIKMVGLIVSLVMREQCVDRRSVQLCVFYRLLLVIQKRGFASEIIGMWNSFISNRLRRLSRFRVPLNMTGSYCLEQQLFNVRKNLTINFSNH